MPSTISQRYKRTCFLCEPPNASILKAHIVKCVVYEYSNNGNVKYATCIFKKESRKDMFIKTKFMNIAERRFNETPEFFKIDKLDDTSYEKQIVNHINELTND